MILAKGLIAVGIQQGDNVFSLGAQGSEALCLFVAATSLGAISSVSYQHKE